MDCRGDTLFDQEMIIALGESGSLARHCALAAPMPACTALRNEKPGASRVRMVKREKTFRTNVILIWRLHVVCA